MIRKLLLIGALLALASESVFAVELGKLQLHSALNQHLNADIPVTKVEGLGKDEILPGLASSAEFDRMGIDRPYALTNLRFTVKKGQNGQMVIHVTSTKPIVEPYLDFLMEVLWPNGRLVREYTVLLNPPVMGKAGVQQLNAPSAQAGSSPPSGQTSTPAPATPRGATTSGAATAPTTVSQLQAANPMGEGSISKGQYGVTGPSDTLWKIAVKVRPDRSVSVQQTMLAIKRSNPGDFIHDNINLLRAGRVLRIPALQAIEQESQDAAIQEVKAQNAAFHAYKTGAPMPQIDAAQRARSPAGGANKGANSGDQLRVLTARNATGAGAAGGGQSSSQSQGLQDKLDETQEGLDKAKRANDELNSRVSDLQGQIKTLDNLVKLKDEQLATLRAAVQKAQSATAAPTPVAQSKSQGSMLSNPIVLIVLALIVVGVVTFGLIFQRRRKASQNIEAADFEEESAAAETTEEPAEVETDEVEAPEQEDEQLSPQTADIISEAEIYIAYGRFPQAIIFLQNAIEAEPDRSDIQLKLLEVYAQTDDNEAFDRQFKQLEALGDAAAITTARGLQQKMSGAIDFIPSGSESAASAEGGTSDDEELSFDLDDLDAETEDSTLDLSSELDLDDDMDLDLRFDDDDDLDRTSHATLDDSDTDMGLDLAHDGSEDALEGLQQETDHGAPISSDASLADEEGLFELDEADLEGTDLDDDAAAPPLDHDQEILTKALNRGPGLDLHDESEQLLGSLDDEFELNLDDDEAALDLSDVEGLEIDEDDEFELNLDEDAGTKLDLARAYIDMGDSDGARNVLQDVLDEGSTAEIQEANELLAKID